MIADDENVAVGQARSEEIGGRSTSNDPFLSWNQVIWSPLVLVGVPRTSI
jgi:hypothetical protein